MSLQKSIIIKTHYNGTPTKVVKLSLLNDANQNNILIMNFENPIISSNMVQIKHFKWSFCNPWKELFKVILIFQIKVHLLLKFIKRIKFSKQFSIIFNRHYIRYFGTTIGIFNTHFL